MKKAGFSIVELLVVIVVIGILVTITTISYVAIQNQARTTRIQTDLKSLQVAIQSAETRNNKVLSAITGSTGTVVPCTAKANGTNLAALPKSDTCWTNYISTLDKISTASGHDVRGLIDPWGRPYYIDENENVAGPTDCTQDKIGAFAQPFLTGYNNFYPSTLVVLDPSSPSGC